MFSFISFFLRCWSVLVFSLFNSFHRGCCSFSFVLSFLFSVLCRWSVPFSSFFAGIFLNYLSLAFKVLYSTYYSFFPAVRAIVYPVSKSRMWRETGLGHQIGIAVRVFANGPGDLGSIPGRVIPKTQKMLLDASLLNTQHYKVRIKGKVEQSRERVAPSPTPWCCSYRKGSLRVTLDYGRQLYLLIAMNNYTYTYTRRNIFNTIKTSGHSSLEKYTSHFIERVVCERQLKTEQRLQHIDPQLFWLSQPFFPVIRGCSTGVI